MDTKMKKKSEFYYAMSLAASWAWGTSLVVGMEIVKIRGVLPFVIWAVANSLAVPLFGLLAYRIKFLEQIVMSKPVTLFTTVVSVFCLWIQMNAIYQELMILTKQRVSIYVQVGIICLFILLAIALNNEGIKKSVIMDNPLWAICYLILVILMFYAVVQQKDRYEILMLGQSEDVKWALNSCFILFSGPIMSIQNWQFAKKLQTENKMSAHYISGILFAVYMAFVGILSGFDFDGFMKFILIFVVIAIALTTGDGAIVGLQEIAGRKVGLLLAAIASVMWPFVIPMGVMGLWTTMGNMRKYVAAACILIAIILSVNRRKKLHE